jgi:hypothetical protein
MSVTQLPLKPSAVKAPRAKPRSAGADGRAMQKGQQTKAAIVDAALGLATQIGLEGLSIGALAEVRCIQLPNIARRRARPRGCCMAG